MNENNSLPSDRMQKHASDQDIKRHGGTGFGGPANVDQRHGTEGTDNNFEEYTGIVGAHTYGTKPQQSTSLHARASQSFDGTTSQPSFFGMDKTEFKGRKSLFDSTASNDGSFEKISSQNSISTLLQSDPSNFSTVASATASTSLYEGDFLLGIFSLMLT